MLRGGGSERGNGSGSGLKGAGADVRIPCWWWLWGLEEVCGGSSSAIGSIGMWGGGRGGEGVGAVEPC